ncbi:hypothetical protein BC831DRAFT_441564 [Entophlyctis helioformis]|nr:hypothetical protein BC831DRAFT_441564 [Entophlyctis helioformis]
MDLAVEHRHYDIVAWLGEHRSEGCSHLAMENAELRGDAEMQQLLRRIRRRQTARSVTGMAQWPLALCLPSFLTGFD